MFLATEYTFHKTHTTLDIEGLRLVYVLPENISVLRDEIYDHAFILFRTPAKLTVDWRKIKNEHRKNIHPKSVRRPLSYLQGYALMMPQHFSVEREELLVRLDDDHIARLFSYSVSGKRFVPHKLKSSVLQQEEEHAARKVVDGQPLIDISTMACPVPDHDEQIPLI